MIRAVATAFAFLTRLPVGVAATTDRDLGAAVGFFPLVGLALGVVAAGLGLVVADTLPATLGAVLVVAMLAAVTGGLHLDGLADLFDGLGGGRGDRARTLEIMRDSRIGPHGAAALTLLLLAKTAAVAALLEARDFSGVLAAPLFARWAVTPQVVLFPYAREQGLGRAFQGSAGRRQLLIATALALALVGVQGWPAARQAGAGLLVSLALALWLRARLRGLTGDVYGATIEICETVCLYMAAVR